MPRIGYVLIDFGSRIVIVHGYRDRLPCPESSLCKIGNLSCLCNSNPAYDRQDQGVTSDEGKQKDVNLEPMNPEPVNGYRYKSWKISRIIKITEI